MPPDGLSLNVASNAASRVERSLSVRACSAKPCTRAAAAKMTCFIVNVVPPLVIPKSPAVLVTECRWIAHTPRAPHCRVPARHPALRRLRRSPSARWIWSPRPARIGNSAHIIPFRARDVTRPPRPCKEVGCVPHPTFLRSVILCMSSFNPRRSQRREASQFGA